VSQLRLRVSGECEGSVAGYGQIAHVTALGGRGSAFGRRISRERGLSLINGQIARAVWLAGWLKGGNLGEWNSNSGWLTETEGCQSQVAGGATG
jgi:hypothetical protein